MEINKDGLQMLISGAIFDFAGYLTTLENVIPVGSSADAAPMVELIKDWAEKRNLNINDAAVMSWHIAYDEAL